MRKETTDHAAPRLEFILQDVRYAMRGLRLRPGFALVVGVTLGVVSGVKQNGPMDYIGVFVATAGAAVPNFVLSVFLVLFFALRLGWFDVIGWEFGNPRQMVLPVI